MADIAYRCHHCGSLHEAESIRENLLLDQRSLASYGSAGRVRGMLARRRAARCVLRAIRLADRNHRGYAGRRGWRPR
jgi:hypothetical protein